MASQEKREILSEAELEARARELGREVIGAQDARRGGVGLVAFQLGPEWFGLPVGHARAVLYRPAVTPVPGTPPFVAGVVNLRGEILGVLDLAVLFGLHRPRNAYAFAVVASAEGVEAAVLAERVEDVVWLEAGREEPVVSTLPPEQAHFFEGIYHDAGRLISVVALPEILRHPPLAALRAP